MELIRRDSLEGMSVKDKGEGQEEVERACPPQGQSDTCDLSPVSCDLWWEGGKKEREGSAAQVWGEPEGGPEQTAYSWSPALGRNGLGLDWEQPGGAPTSASLCSPGSWRPDSPRLSLQGNLSATLPWLPQMACTTWQTPHRRSARGRCLRNPYARVKSLLLDLTFSPSPLGWASVSQGVKCES